MGGGQIFLKGLGSTFLGFVGHKVYAAAPQLFHCSVKAPINNM